MSPALDHLPREILHMTLAYLDIDCRYSTEFEPPDAHFRYSRQKLDQPSWYSLRLQPLLSLCLVSKRLCSAIQPILYSEFMLGYGDSWRSELYTWDGRLLSFLQTVARRRDLAEFVKRIHILPHLLQASLKALEKEERDRQRLLNEGKARARPNPELRQSILKAEARDTLREIAVALRIKEPKRLSAKDLVTLLIAALPKLEHCSLFIGPDSDMISVDTATLSAAGISQLPLRTINLSVLRTAEKYFDLDYNARALLDVSPCLETLNLHKCYGTLYKYYGTRKRAALPFLPRLKHVRITSSRLSEQGLENILNSCDSLCSFTYEAGGHLGEDWSEETWDCSDHFQLRNAARYLSRHRKTLKSVHIDLRHRGGNPATPSPFSFRELTALKHLFLNLDEFHSRFFMHRWTDDSQILVQILPSGVDSLHLAGRIGEDIPRLEKALLGLGEAALKGQFQNLKEVRWDENAKLHAEDAVRSLFADAGVDFAYDSWPLTRLSFYQGDYTPPGNFEHPYWAMPDSDYSDL
ncbi:hypothetical protein P168DRAFT_192021 [Aspergillus campestris IBT 28561]|uniref:F-box domain-containing protein n=1 Tax=Aspergillus campestris (strain IBT 28561) TaxID=1392248 RepID=A0A2I1CYW1_ASPC2|nr:uncharacterized protein P168DRAFT_192021 [Aspergillus campestris IBT 28561]PKY02819.1 hypothetical protein P168DRAFT_192021 [Aspergillus campestris IBT 28561]